ncbi:hypothetical protein BGZ61DRAFT_121246 [Ilyonectria robusta]|uniref:uncharacterized protein n=1 Tax=Ilyonectria robusta TaxID=1079257 RepID=UPI001E8CD3B7|nr:uncharacterized protein BGZ61DRAFT_121246 [Ilyonectria robusta]KAH8666139.1 hypothetical protein BGZ61DRAFT_121246 [Ilyonectria robusta]
MKKSSYPGPSLGCAFHFNHKFEALPPQELDQGNRCRYLRLTINILRALKSLSVLAAGARIYLAEKFSIELPLQHNVWLLHSISVSPAKNIEPREHAARGDIGSSFPPWPRIREVGSSDVYAQVQEYEESVGPAVGEVVSSNKVRSVRIY